MALCQRLRAQMVGLFFLVFIYILQEDLEKSPKCQGPGNVIPARSIKWLVLV